ncbi:uncharacterized protein F5147DRAFT_345825 [Suillus discolor]|uniref:Uncharacterized protein n=1 Tax=Suillus discolor TaxID=1912936 RepID=A0A9P7FEV0_9AGAM|nr:uncharacterized protein F5147DRAFT_345825 [Suillus discolor]KAG2116462.1 hypothetical protein F5147DRAFT_345825 [Suillus discolor]
MPQMGFSRPLAFVSVHVEIRILVLRYENGSGLCAHSQIVLSFEDSRFEFSLFFFVLPISLFGLVLLSPSDPTSAPDTKSVSAPKGCFFLLPIRALLSLNARAFGHSEPQTQSSKSFIDTEQKPVSANQHQPFPHKNQILQLTIRAREDLFLLSQNSHALFRRYLPSTNISTLPRSKIDIVY